MLIRLILSLILFTLSLLGEEKLRIATYNVENLFDLQRSGYEYKEYIPNSTSQWNQKNYQIKLNNLSKVIKDINADILALQEVESLQALKDLRKKLQSKGIYYPYYKIANAKGTTVKVALLSKVPFVYTKELFVTHSTKYRNILEAKFKLNGEDLYLFVNHWKSKAGPESMRIVSAKKLKQRIKELPAQANIVVLGDLNSDYEEYIRFVRKRKLNNTNGKTGINHILGTVNYQTDTNRVNIHPFELYNLWYDIPNEDRRYSYKYRGKKEALDHILVNAALLDKNGVDYIPDSFHVFEKSYLFRGKNIYRWQMRWKRPRKHLGRGYSDHLPLIADFTLNTNQ
jgi:endonuclease/exonuclease/phosphatase family metal-dependent hydrolase